MFSINIHFVLLQQNGITLFFSNFAQKFVASVLLYEKQIEQIYK
jgi:hypothetical protein